MSRSSKTHAGHLISTMRGVAGLSRAELAKKAGVGRTTIYRIETTGKCHLQTFEKVKRVLLNILPELERT